MKSWRENVNLSPRFLSMLTVCATELAIACLKTGYKYIRSLKNFNARHYISNLFLADKDEGVCGGYDGHEADAL